MYIWLKKLQIPFLCFALYLCGANVGFGAQLRSIQVDSDGETTTLATYFSEHSSIGQIDLLDKGDHLAIFVRGASIDPQYRAPYIAQSDVIRDVKVEQKSGNAIVSIYTSESPAIVKSASKIGVYQGDILLNIDHNLIAEQVQAVATRSFDLGELSHIFWFASLLLILGLFFLFIPTKLRKFPTPKATRQKGGVVIQTLATIPPTKSHELSIIEVSGEKLLIANGPSGVQLLTPLAKGSVQGLRYPSTIANPAGDREKEQLISRLRDQIREKMHSKNQGRLNG